MAGAGKTVEDDGDLDGVVSWALEVVAVTSRNGAVESGFAAGVARVENLEDVPFTASRFPARAVGGAVLKGTGNLGVKHPSSGHILVPASVAGHGHGEFQKEELAVTTETI